VTRALSTCLAALLFACGEDDRVAATTGVEGSKRLDSLSAPELRLVCSWYIDVQLEGNARDRVCIPDAVYATRTQAECVEDLDLCRARFGKNRELLRDSVFADCEQTAFARDCEATVAQFELCLRDYLEDSAAFAAELSCQRPMPSPRFFGVADVPSCMPVGAGCMP
jgi:hypothetical protein